MNKIEIEWLICGGWVVAYIDGSDRVMKRAFGADQWDLLLKYITGHLNLG